VVLFAFLSSELSVISFNILIYMVRLSERLCDLVVTVPGYRFRGPGFYSRRYQFFKEVMGLERGPISPVRISEELLESYSSGSGLET
jgi:hypothetical protein